MKIRTLNGLTIVLLALTMVGCASNGVRYSGGGYGGGGCRNCGEVLTVDRVWVDRQASGGGALLGAIIGGALGHQVGGGSGKKVATGAGIVAGAVIGNEIEKGGGGEEQVFRIVMRLDDGRRAVITQREPPRVRRGDYAYIENDRVYRMRDPGYR